jgi:EF-P beta-lysylation protein EpmB
MAIVTSQAHSVRASSAGWQEAMRTAIRDGVELCRRLSLPAEYEEAAARAGRFFPVFAPLGYVAKMRPGDPHDPLLRQVLPLGEELDQPAGYTADPVADNTAALTPGLLQKYRGRALMITSGACAIHCRYCFRRHFPYRDAPHSLAQWQPAIDRLAEDGIVEEIVLSGGDPLTLVDSQLRQLVDRLAAIPQLRRIRVHSRLPIVIPDRVGEEMIGWLRATRLTPLVVVHANHPAELDDAVGNAIGRLVDAGVPMLNQTVLLRGVNDDVETLVSLGRRLVDLRVLPYYLHQLDRVSGAAHFEVPIEEGRRLVDQIRARLPGYAVPRYVQEVAGAPYKWLLF